MLCLGEVLLVWQSALSEGYFTTVAECSVWGFIYYCGRVLCLGDISAKTFLGEGKDGV